MDLGAESRHRGASAGNIDRTEAGYQEGKEENWGEGCEQRTGGGETVRAAGGQGGLASTEMGCVGRVARMVGPGDGRAGEGCWGVVGRTGDSDRPEGWEVGNAGTGVHGGEELTGVGGRWGLPGQKCSCWIRWAEGGEEVDKLLQLIFWLIPCLHCVGS